MTQTRGWRRKLAILAATIAAGLCLALAMPARATINSSLNRVVVSGTGAQTVFSFPFVGVTAADISVSYTDASGILTVLSAGSGPTQYQITLNPPGTGQIWGIGGTVVYNPNGTPIAAGTTLTILRTVPLTQTQSLANQGSLFPKAVEQMGDLAVMQAQQLAQAYGQAIVVAPSDPPPLALPPAAQRANQALVFDASGNPIAGAIPASGVISSAMQPVVGAASLALGRLAFGLGSMALENLGGSCGGASIQDDGSAGGANGVGYARVVYAVASDSTNQAVTCAFHNSQRLATGPITYTLPRASTTLFNGWGFWIDAVAGTVTITPNANDNFSGQAAGTSVGLAAGAACWVSTNGAASATWLIDCTNPTPALSANASGNALTLTLSAPAIAFRAVTAASGAPLMSVPAAGLSITLPANATLGTLSGVPFRIWIFAAYNGGAPVLGAAICSSAAIVYPCAGWEVLQKSGTAVTAAATAAGTLYTSSAVTNDSVRIIGYADYASGLATAGTWLSAPTTLQSCLPPFTCKRPGDVIQSLSAATAANVSTTNVYAVSATPPAPAGGAVAIAAPAITPGSAANLVRVTGAGLVGNATSSQSTVFVHNGSATLAAAIAAFANGQAQTIPIRYQAVANGTAPVTYTLYFTCNNTGCQLNNNGSATLGGAATYIQVDEIMGATTDPVNDNIDPGRYARAA